jgi:hypothetical protein
VAQRGDLTYARLNHRGLQTFLLFECPGDTRNRLGIWFTLEPVHEPGSHAGAIESTAADESSIRTLLAPFHLCSR